MKNFSINETLFGVVGPIIGVTGVLVGLAKKRKMNEIITNLFVFILIILQTLTFLLKCIIQSPNWVIETQYGDRMLFAGSKINEFENY